MNTNLHLHQHIWLIISDIWEMRLIIMVVCLVKYSILLGLLIWRCKVLLGFKTWLNWQLWEVNYIFKVVCQVRDSISIGLIIWLQSNILYKELLYEPRSYFRILSAHIINYCFLVGQWQFAYLMHYAQYEFTIM